MCDYSLMAVPNRLAREGEELVAHRFPTGSLGLACPADLRRAANPAPPARRGWWRAMTEFFNPTKTEPVPAVCIPPGARLMLHDIPLRLQNEIGVGPVETVTFTQMTGTNKVAWLADPIECPVDGEVGEGGHTEDGIWEDRRPFRLLLFGHITRRKGAGNLLRALELLPRQVCQLTSLAIVGKVEDGYRAELAQAVARTLQGTSARVVVVDEFVKDETVERLIRTASVVMAPYLEHEGMSGVLLHAAAQGKPVVTSTHGLIGMLTRENKLGFAVDCGHPGEIARALNELFGPGTNPEFDREGAMFFARQHHYSQYGARIAETLTLNSSRLSEEQL